jgi:hypothetical protein
VVERVTDNDEVGGSIPPAPTERSKTLKKKIFLSERHISIKVFKVNGNVFAEATLLDPDHLIRLTMVIDPVEKKILEAKAEMPNSPFLVCKQTIEKIQKLEGLIIGKGVMKKLAEAVGGPCGCIHLRDLASEAVSKVAGDLVGYEEGHSLFSQEPKAIHFKQTEKELSDTCLAYKQD